MLHIILLVMLVVGLSVFATVGLVALVRVFQRGRPIVRGTADVEGVYITVLGGLYAIFVAFMIFVVWTRFYEARQRVDLEADTVAGVYNLSAGLPEPLKGRLQDASLDYARVMVRYEWRDMAEERFPRRGQELVDRMREVINATGPDTVDDDVLRDHLLTSFDELTELRRFRLLESRTSLPGILYAGLIFGGLLTLGFAALFTVEEFWSHILKAAVLAAMISFMLLTVWMLDHPFQGSVHVDAAPFERTLELFD